LAERFKALDLKSSVRETVPGVQIPHPPYILEKKNQHFIPRSYLAAWCDPTTPAGHEPYVWRFDKDGTNRRKKSPANLFSETDTYTITTADWKRDLTLENGLAELESRFGERNF
jgi:hypothetical protein